MIQRHIYYKILNLSCFLWSIATCMHFCMVCKQQNFFENQIFADDFWYINFLQSKFITCKSLNLIVHKGSIFHFLVDMIVGQRQKAYKQVNSTMDGREATDGECYDYTSFISGFESNRKCLVCHEDLFEKCCKTKEEGRTSARNCFVLEHSLCWEVWPLHWPCSSRHTSCCLECRWTYPVLVKFCVLSGVLNLSITTVHLLKKWSCLCYFKSWKDIAKLIVWMKCLVVYCWNPTSVHVHKMCIKFWMR